MPEGSGASDPLSIEALVQRHQNRRVLLDRLSSLRGQLRQLEGQVADIERTVQGLPYDFRQQRGADEALAARRFGFVANVAAGGAALPLSMICVHPLDTVRVMMQSAIHEEQGFSRVVRSLGVRGFARGFGTSIFWACPQGGIRLGCYEASKETLAGSFDLRPLSVAVSAVVGDLASSVVKVPRELVTQQVQTGQHASAFGAFRTIVEQDGVAGLFRGYSATCFRDTPFIVVLFLSYEQFKSWKIRLTFAHHGPSQVLSPWSDAETVLWGGISGAIAAFLTTPFDVIKTRIMTSPGHLTITRALRGIGVNNLFLGAGPRSAWWFCVSSVFFASFERLRFFVQDAVDG